MWGKSWLYYKGHRRLLLCKTPDGIVECKARGIFRKRGITPVAGDNVTLSDDGTMIDEILPRKNVFIRPPIANLDILFIVTSTTQPVPSTWCWTSWPPLPSTRMCSPCLW